MLTNKNDLMFHGIEIIPKTIVLARQRKATEAPRHRWAM